MHKDFELTKVEVVLHEFNRAAIDKFLKANGFEVHGDDWGRKIKQVLLVIDEVQQGVRKEKKRKKITLSAGQAERASNWECKFGQKGLFVSPIIKQKIKI